MKEMEKVVQEETFEIEVQYCDPDDCLHDFIQTEHIAVTKLRPTLRTQLGGAPHVDIAVHVPFDIIDIAAL